MTGSNQREVPLPARAPPPRGGHGPRREGDGRQGRRQHGIQVGAGRLGDAPVEQVVGRPQAAAARARSPSGAGWGSSPRAAHVRVPGEQRGAERRAREGDHARRAQPRARDAGSWPAAPRRQRTPAASRSARAPGRPRPRSRPSPSTLPVTAPTTQMAHADDRTGACWRSTTAQAADCRADQDDDDGGPGGNAVAVVLVVLVLCHGARLLLLGVYAAIVPDMGGRLLSPTLCQVACGRRGGLRDRGVVPASRRSQSLATRWPRAPVASPRASRSGRPARASCRGPTQPRRPRTRSSRGDAGTSTARRSTLAWVSTRPVRPAGGRPRHPSAPAGSSSTRPTRGTPSPSAGQGEDARVTRRTTAPAVVLATRGGARRRGPARRHPEATWLPVPAIRLAPRARVVDGAACTQMREPLIEQHAGADEGQQHHDEPWRSGAGASPDRPQCAAVATARRAAAALLTVSSNSAVGTESATMPGTGLHVRDAVLDTAVRIAIAMSRSPWKSR